MTPAPTVEIPYTMEDLGVTVLLPEGVKVDAQFIPGGRSKAVLTAKDNTWVVQIFNANSADTTLTTSQVLDNFIEQRRAALRDFEDANPDLFGRGINRRSALVVSGRQDPSELTVAGQPAGRFYCDTPQIVPNIVTGYTVFQNAPGRFLIMQLDCMAESFPTARGYYELIVASATFADPEQANIERATALLAGRSFLQSISNEDIEAALLEKPVFYRYFIPASTGLDSDAVEIGWQRAEMRLGQRGELDFNKPRDRWTAADREFGYLVRMDGQFRDGNRVTETRAGYFLDRPRANEAISVFNVIRVNGEVAATATTTAIRRGSMLTMKLEQTGSPGESRDWSVPDEYISRVELELLPRLVALKTPEGSAAEYDFGFFHFNFTVPNPSILMRRDKFSNTDIASRGWRYNSEPGPRLAPVSTTLDQSGTMIRRTGSRGVVVERIELERLRQIQKDNKIGS